MVLLLLFLSLAAADKDVVEVAGFKSEGEDLALWGGSAAVLWVLEFSKYRLCDSGNPF